MHLLITLVYLKSQKETQLIVLIKLKLGIIESTIT